MNEIINNEDQMQFQMEVDGEMALLEYRFHDDQIMLMHTEVPKSFEGKGVGSALARYAFEWAKQHDKKVKVYCAFVKTYLERHSEYKDLVV